MAGRRRFGPARPDAPGDHRVQDDSGPQKRAVTLGDLVSLALGEEAPISGRRGGHQAEGQRPGEPTSSTRPRGPTRGEKNSDTR